MDKTEIAFKISSKDFKNSTSIGGHVIYKDSQLIKINTEYLNPYRCEGYAIIFIQVDGKRYIRCFESKVSDFHLMNFINKFVRNGSYRQQYLAKSANSDSSSTL